MYFIYPALFHEEDGQYWVEFPDLEGCQSFGESLSETIENAKEALAGYCTVLVEQGKKLPTPSAVNDVPAEEGAFVSLVDAKPLSAKRAVKKTLSIPAWLNERAEAAHAQYSAILQEGLEKFLGLA